MKDNKRLKELSDNYEVDFDSAAWDKMEKLLPEASSPRVPFFKRFRFVVVVVLLLITFVGGLFITLKKGVEETVIVENKTEFIIDNQEVTIDNQGVIETKTPIVTKLAKKRKTVSINLKSPKASLPNTRVLKTLIAKPRPTPIMVEPYNVIVLFIVSLSMFTLRTVFI